MFTNSQILSLASRQCFFVFWAILLVYPNYSSGQKSKIKSNGSGVKSNLQKLDVTSFPNLTEEIEQDSGRLLAYFKSQFQDPDNRVEAIYGWITSSFQYDKAAMFDFDKADYSIPSILQKRQGVCMDVAKLFEFLCIKTGIQSYVVSGFTNERAIVGHAWNICWYKNKLNLFDATWDLKDSTIQKPPTRRYFAAEPAFFIKQHMPFHPMWQLLSRPISESEFEAEKLEMSQLQGSYYFQDTIRQFSNLSKQDQNLVYLNWFKKNRPTNYATMQAARSFKHNAYVYEFNRLDKAYDEINLAINQFNAYIEFFNHRFLPKREDIFFIEVIRKIDLYIETGQGQFRSVNWDYFEKEDAEKKQINFHTLTESFIPRWEKHKKFILLYLSKSTFGKVFIFSNQANNPER